MTAMDGGNAGNAGAIASQLAALTLFDDIRRDPTMTLAAATLC
jgi:hypothetical protein